jgi:hypothetical protein
VTIATPASTRLHSGDKIQLTATVVLPNGKEKDKFPIKWSTSSPTVATVNEKTGEVTAVAPGAVTITAQAGPRTGQLALTVMVPVARVRISPNFVRLDWNTHNPEKVLLTAEAFDAAGALISDLADRSIVWTSAEPTTATVAATVPPVMGLVTGVLMGKTTISVTVDGVPDTAQIDVRPWQAYLNISYSIYGEEFTRLAVGDSVLATMYFISYDDVKLRVDETTPGPKSWFSVYPWVATVTPAGVVHAVATGWTNIIGTYRGITATAYLIVDEPAP